MTPGNDTRKGQGEQLPPSSPGQEDVQEDLLFLQTDVQSYKVFRYGLFHQPRLSLRGIILSESPPEIQMLKSDRARVV